MKSLKILFLSTILLLMGNLANAQVSAATVKADVGKKFTGATSIEVIGNGTYTEEWEGSTKVYYHRRQVKVVSKTSFAKELPDSRAIVDGMAVYTKQGGKYVYKQFNAGYEELTGMPPIDIDKINKFIAENLCKEVVNNCNNILAESFPKLKMTKDSKITWYSPTSFSFHIDSIQLKRWRNSTTVDIQLGKADIRFYRDDMNSEWTRVLRGSGFSLIKTIGEEKYPEGELDKKKYLDQVVQE